MEKNKNTDANFRMVKRLMEQYDQKQAKASLSAGAKRMSGDERKAESNELKDRGETMMRNQSSYNRYSQLIVRDDAARVSDLVIK